MDILDIDEALKDDSFIFLEDKTHDDISNILQQWKSNNYMPPSSNTQTQQQQEQAYKLDSRTFTRPKRKLAQNLEQQFTNTSSSASHYQQNQPQQTYNNSQHDNPMLNLEIGGLVTNMQKSFLHDVSPPSFSSMDASIDRMNNSLITSADFSNINFLQSTNSLDFGGNDINDHGDFDLMGKITNDGYTLSDMIRDRKALESLTMSSEGTLIKDMHIGQIDDISLTLSKTASGCSTMDNSTESVEANNRTIEIPNKNRGLSDLKSSNGGSCNSNSGLDLNRTMVLTDEMIGDITYNLVENSMYGSMASEKAHNLTHSLTKSQQPGSEIISKPASSLDQTICISTDGICGVTVEKTENSTFDCQENITPNNRCETPEGVEKPITSLKYYESTPQATSVRYNKQHFTPTLKMVDDVNISPIIASSAMLPNNATRVLNDTFEHEQRVNKANKIINTNTFSGKLPLNATVEMIENIENPNGTYEKQSRRFEPPSPVSLEMKNVMALAQAEANLLASNNNEEEFDHMLDEFSKVELNAEQLKMKKSLDSIKKRFNYGPNKDRSHPREISREAKDMRDMMRVSADILGEDDHSSKDYLNMTMDIVGKSDIKLSKETLVESPHALSEGMDGIRSPLKDSVTSSSISESKISNGGLSMSSASSASNGGERLLSRRSRLYDDFNLSTLSPSSTHGSKISLGSSFTVHKDDDHNVAATTTDETRPNLTSETENVSSQNALEMVQEKTENATEEANAEATTACAQAQDTSSAAQYKLAEKRERDRDRFKTIKINKNRSGSGTGQNGLELNVPCIDDFDVDVNADASLQQSNSRISRRDQTVSPVFNNNKSEVEIADTNKTASKINPNYLTYKKPKDKQQANVRNLPEIAPASTNTIAVAPDANKPRSLSRPRYLSGLTKFSAVSKATSADELEKSIPRQTNLNATTSNAISSGLIKATSAANRTLIGGQANAQPSGELKSPMGVKSKSFHNLSSNHTSASNISIGGGGGVPAPKTFGLRKPSATSTEKLVKTNPNRNSALLNPVNVQQSIAQQSEETVFKVPKLVSGLRAPGSISNNSTTAASKRAGLARPSSGYFSLNVTAKGVTQAHPDADSDNGRHSPTDSMSSASSRGSAQSLNKPIGIKAPSANTTTNTTAIKTSNINATAGLTKITVGSTGIPKPSGLRPPSAIKRSGLPRPSSFAK
ncbi:short spindle 2 isoform X2 [Musca autumnalis]|uniref:short spindle 2 isoform X2 n=1 Tax=Musca autumnalis TaxID=221902 RepID=UPI003CF98AE3